MTVREVYIVLERDSGEGSEVKAICEHKARAINIVADFNRRKAATEFPSDFYWELQVHQVDQAEGEAPQ